MLFLIKCCCWRRLLYLLLLCLHCKRFILFLFLSKKLFPCVAPGLINTLASGFPSEKPASIAHNLTWDPFGEHLHVFFPALTGALDPSRPLVRNCLVGSFSHQHLQGETVKYLSHGCAEMVQISAWHQPWSLMREIDGELWASKDWSWDLWTQ